MSEKKKNQLGMNPSTASNRLVKDILWSMIVKTGQNYCFKCNLEMTRETFTIEHKAHWLDSKDPVKMYFDLNNIAFSHHSCNVSDKRDTRKLKPCGTRASYDRGCRCISCKNAKKEYHSNRF